MMSLSFLNLWAYNFTMRWMILVLIFSLLGCTTSKKDAESAELYLQLGTNQLQKGFPAQALGTLLKAEQLDPRSVQIQNYLGVSYFVLKQYKKAIVHLEKSIKLDPTYTEGRNNLARAQIEAHRYKDARENLNVVLEDLTYTQPHLALTNMAMLNFQEKNYSAAIPYLQKALRYDKANCLAYNLYARSLYEKGDINSSLPMFDTAIPLCKKTSFDEAHYYAAIAYYKSGQKNKGIALMNETILLYPEGNYQGKARTTLDQMKMNRF